MKTYKSSDLTHKRAEVFKEAKTNGVIVEKRNTNGDVELEFLLILKPVSKDEFAKKYPNEDVFKGCHNPWSGSNYNDWLNSNNK